MAYTNAEKVIGTIAVSAVFGTWFIGALYCFQRGQILGGIISLGLIGVYTYFAKEANLLKLKGLL